MATHNLSEITLEQLTKACGIPAFDIVRHYHNKENILAAVLERELEMIAGAVPSPELRFPSETLRDELQVIAKIMLQEYRSRIAFMGKILTETMTNPEVGALFYTKFILQGRLLFTEFLNIRQAAGELRDDVDVEAAAALFPFRRSTAYCWWSSCLAASRWRRWTKSGWCARCRTCSCGESRCEGKGLLTRDRPPSHLFLPGAHARSHGRAAQRRFPFSLPAVPGPARAWPGAASRDL